MKSISKWEALWVKKKHDVEMQRWHNKGKCWKKRKTTENNGKQYLKKKQKQTCIVKSDDLRALPCIEI